MSSASTTTASPLAMSDTIDTRINETRMREFSDLMMAQSDGTYKPPVDEITRIADTNTYAGYGINDVVKLDNLFTQHIQKYLNETNQLLMMNDMIASSEYLRNTMDNEYDRVSKLTEKTKNNIYKSRASYMFKRYQIGYNRFVSGVLQFTMFVFVVLAVLCAVWRQSLALPQGASMALWQNPSILLACAVILVVLYLLIVILLYKTYQTRRKDDWDKFYFRAPA